MDKRKNNGGHSTKATRPDDKRKNQGRALIERYLKDDFSYDDLKKVFDKLFEQATIKGDTKSASLLLSYVLGKPKESKDITSQGEKIQTIINLGIGDE